MLATRRTLMAGLVAVFGSLSLSAVAGEMQPFTEQAFDAAQKAGKPILIDTYADWCDICKRQKPIIEKLIGEPKFKELVTLRVNFDSQRDVMRKFNARQQSTLIVFQGSKEVGRSIGETQEEWVEELLDKAVEKGSSS